MKMNADWSKAVFQQSMDDLSFISDTLFAKSEHIMFQQNHNSRLFPISQKLNIADDYTGKCALYLGQAENQLPSPHTCTCFCFSFN